MIARWMTWQDFLLKGKLYHIFVHFPCYYILFKQYILSTSRNSSALHDVTALSINDWIKYLKIKINSLKIAL